MPADPFDTLGLAPRFDLEPGEVERAYRRRAGAVHPDVSSGNDEAPGLAADVNHARTALLDPEQRAAALLARLGGPSKEQDKSLPPGFLGEIMELRETIEAATRGKDDAERLRWRAWAEARRNEILSRVGAAFAALPPVPTPESLRAIRVELNAWRYVERLIEQLDPEYDPRRADFQP